MKILIMSQSRHAVYNIDNISCIFKRNGKLDDDKNFYIDFMINRRDVPYSVASYTSEIARDIAFNKLFNKLLDRIKKSGSETVLHKPEVVLIEIE